MILASLAERRKIFRDLILQHPDWSIRRICSLYEGPSRHMVGAVRRDMIDRGEIPDCRRVVGRDGKSQVYRAPNRGGRPPSGLANKTRALVRLAESVGEPMYRRASRRERAEFHAAVDGLRETWDSLRWRLLEERAS